MTDTLKATALRRSVSVNCIFVVASSSLQSLLTAKVKKDNKQNITYNYALRYVTLLLSASAKQNGTHQRHKRAVYIEREFSSYKDKEYNLPVRLFLPFIDQGPRPPATAVGK